MNSSGQASCLCFSMDRALQLEGYLGSLKKFMSDNVFVTVLYRTSSDFFDQGYDAVMQKHPDVNFIRETDFGAQTLGWLDSITTPLAMFGCDDVVYYRSVSLAKAASCFQSPQVLGFSLRLGKNIRFTHRQARPVAQPAWSEENDLLFWRWQQGNWDWGWAFEVNGTLYPRQVIKALFRALEQNRRANSQFDWRHPNKLEMTCNQLLRSIVGAPPLLACFPRSCLVVPTVNQVQTLGNNPLLGASRTVRELEELRRREMGMDLDRFAAGAYERIHVGDFFLK